MDLNEFSDLIASGAPFNVEDDELQASIVFALSANKVVSKVEPEVVETTLAYYQLNKNVLVEGNAAKRTFTVEASGGAPEIKVELKTTAGGFSFALQNQEKQL